MLANMTKSSLTRISAVETIYVNADAFGVFGEEGESSYTYFKGVVKTGVLTSAQ